MFKTTAMVLAAALAGGAATAQEMMGSKYEVTVINNLSEELLAPILITDVTNDGHIFLGDYVTPEAEDQILTGDPGMLVARIGEDAMVGHGMDGPPGVLLAPGKTVTFTIETDATAVRVLSMVAPTMVPDNYVSNVVDLHAQSVVEAPLQRFDIGHNEETMMNMALGTAPASIIFKKL